MKNAQQINNERYKNKISNLKTTIPLIGLSLLTLLNSCENNEQKKSRESPIQNEMIENNMKKLKTEAENNFQHNNFSESLNEFFQLLKYQEAKNDTEWIRRTNRRIGMIFLRQEKTEEALDYFIKCLPLAKQIGYNAGIIITQAHIWEVYEKLGKDTLSIKTFMEWRKFAESIKNPDTTAIKAKIILGTDIARRYLKKENNPELAKQYRKECIKLNQQTNNIENTITLKYDIGDYNLHTKNTQEVFKYYLEWFQLAKENNNSRREEVWCSKISNRYKENNSPEEALKYKELEDSLKDIRINKESINQVNELNIQYETEKKEQQITLQQTEIDKQSEQKKRMLWTTIASLIAALGLGSTGAMFYRQKRQLRRKNIEIDRQKQKVETQNRALDEKNQIIEQKNKNITDSINYAKYIQNAALQNPEHLKKMFPESFMFFQPKDIVSWDFYRFREIPSGKKFIAAVDCTGHGVPGAFLSFIGNNILNDAIKDGKDNPADILNYLSSWISKQLQKNSYQADAIKDAMDIAICSYDPQTGILETAGAYNAIYIFNDHEMIETKPDKRPIGTDFTTCFNGYRNHQIQVKPGNTIYLGSDGYADQFGWPNNKKMLVKRLKTLLKDLQRIQEIPGETERRKLTMDEQHQKLKEFFQQRRGDDEQTDDVLVIGIKV